jgi:hypothetical protein
LILLDLLIRLMKPPLSDTVKPSLLMDALLCLPLLDS